MQKNNLDCNSKYLWGISAKYRRDASITEFMKRTFIFLNFVHNCDISVVLDTLKRTYKVRIDSVQDYSNLFAFGDHVDLASSISFLKTCYTYSLIYFVSSAHVIVGNDEWLKQHKCNKDIVITNNGSILFAKFALK